MAADIEIFNYVGKSVESVLDTFVQSTSANMIGNLSGTITAAVTLYFVIFGYMVMAGYIRNSVWEFVKRAVTIAFIVGFALTAGNYQSNVVETFRGLETGLSSMVYTQGGATNVYQVLDKSFSSGLDLAVQAFEQASKCWGIGAAIGWLLNGVIIVVATLCITIVAAAFIMLAKVALSILLGIGPIFIMCLIFPPVRRFFDAWAGQVITYTLVLVFMAAIMGFETHIFNVFVSNVKLDNSDTNALSAAVQILVLSACLVVIALQVPQIAAALGGGVGLSMLNPLSPSATAGRTFSRVKNTVNPMSTRRDMASGGAHTNSRLGHMMRGNTVANPAYCRRSFDSMRKGWGSGGGSVEKT